MFSQALRTITIGLLVSAGQLSASECDPKATAKISTDVTLFCFEVCTEARDGFTIDQAIGSGQQPDFSPLGEPLAINKLILNKVISPVACLEVKGVVGPGISSNVSVLATIFINGERWTQFTISRQASDQKVRQLELPIRYLRFAMRSGQRNAPPSPGRNNVRAVFQVLSGSICNSCAVSVSLGKLTFTALAPYMLVHGRASSPAWFNGGFENALSLRGVGYKAVGVASGEKPDMGSYPTLDSVNIPESGLALRTHAEIMAREFGVKRIHVVAHSKGGLWSRAMIDSSNGTSPEVGVYSITSITSPHRGSVLADISVAAQELSQYGAKREGLLLTKLLGVIPFDKSLRPVSAERHAGLYSLPEILETAERSNRVAYASYQADANLNGDTISPSGLANITLNEACTSQADLLSFCAPVPLLPYSTLAGFPSTFKFDTIGAQLSYLLQVLEGAYVDDRFAIPLVEFMPKIPPFEFNDFAVTASSSIFPPFATIETLKAHHNAVSNPQTANKILDLINLDLQKALER